VTGDNNRVSTSMRQVSLPAAAEVDVRTELAALRRVLAGLKVPERGKLDRAMEEAAEEVAKPHPDREELGGALGRALRYARRRRTSAGMRRGWPRASPRSAPGSAPSGGACSPTSASGHEPAEAPAMTDRSV
jgi:hypothetical protein